MNSPASRSEASSAIPRSAASVLSVTVCVCTRDRPELLRHCLESLVRLVPPANEILVVDNSSGNPVTQQIAHDFGARYSVEPEKGLSRARNRGVAESNSIVVAFLDDDATAEPGWLHHLMHPFEAPSTAAVTGRIITPQTPPLTPDQMETRSLCSQDPHWFEAASFGGVGLGSNMALRKSACVGFKVFDERLGRGAPFQIAEENYAFAMLLSLGHMAVHVPSAIVYHPRLHRIDAEQEASYWMTYWLLLFSEFPAHRLDLLRFLFARLRRKKLTWPRDPQDAGEIIQASWLVKLKAGVTGTLLFLRSRSKP